jgi:hypothetical protein
VQDPRDGWTHAHGFAELPNGDIVVSFRHISTVIIIDRKTEKIIWKLGAPPLSGQHAPTPLPNGNLLLFDNGPHRFPTPAVRASTSEQGGKERTAFYAVPAAYRSDNSRKITSPFS